MPDKEFKCVYCRELATVFVGFISIAPGFSSSGGFCDKCFTEHTDRMRAPTSQIVLMKLPEQREQALAWAKESDAQKKKRRVA